MVTNASTDSWALTGGYDPSRDNAASDFNEGRVRFLVSTDLRASTTPGGGSSCTASDECDWTSGRQCSKVI